MEHIEYMPCPADPALWMHPMVRPIYRTEYYAYILLYFDDIFWIHHDAKSFLMKVDKCFKLKPESIRDPDIYLGSKLQPMKLENGVWAWYLSPS